MIEVDVHQHLREFLREQQEPHWPHHLTIARLVARALRLQRSALIQVGAAAAYQGKHRLSYLVPLLISPEPVILVAPEPILNHLLRTEVPRLSAFLPVAKPVRTGECWPEANFRGLLLTTPAQWLGNYFQQQNHFPARVPVIIDAAEDLEFWVRQQLTVSLRSLDWEDLMLGYPRLVETIRNTRVQLTKAVFQHPVNPYACALVEQPEREILDNLYQHLQVMAQPLPRNWQRFQQLLHREDGLLWVDIDRDQGQFTFQAAPGDLAADLQDLWPAQPVVLLGSSLDAETDASFYRQQFGLGELTCLKFAPDRQTEGIQLYLCEQMPMPNTPEFQAALLGQLGQLLHQEATSGGLSVVIVDDLPLKGQVGSLLAAEFGTRVQVESTVLSDNSILVTGWRFWQQHQAYLKPPRLLVIATLPIPSLEDPRVAARVAYYKRRRQDWFRLYLLPTALSQLDRAIASVREQAGILAILDPRVVHRSYGQQVLAVLSPYSRINYGRSPWVPLAGCPLGINHDD